MRLLLPSNMSKEEENKWAKDQEEQIANAEMRNVEKNIPLAGARQDF